MAELQPVEVALEALLSGITPLGSEQVALYEAAGRVLSEAAIATLNVPSFDNSAMDGYALRAADAGKPLPISQRIVAGVPAKPLVGDSCARIFTGGVIPEGADCVVIQENALSVDDKVLFPNEVTLGDNIRRVGCDVRQGDVLLPAGERIEAAALGHLAGQGVAYVRVRQRPRIALLSTGDEIVDPGQALQPGQIYNSNRPMLKRLLERFGADVVQLVNVPDDFSQTVELLKQAAEVADVVVSTGGVSVGEEDHVKRALDSLGKLDIWKLAIRPGKPLALGRLFDTQGREVRFVGLPGNPVSAFVGGWLFLRPLIGGLLGCPSLRQLPEITAAANFAAKSGPRQHYMRVSLRFTVNGVMAEAFADQSSAVLSSCVQADALAVIEAHRQLNAGDKVRCLWLRG